MDSRGEKEIHDLAISRALFTHSVASVWRISKPSAAARWISHPNGHKIYLTARRSAVANHNLAEMAAGFEMPVGFLCLGERKDAVDHRAQVMHSNGPVHRLEIGAAADADCADGNVTPTGQQQGIEARFRMATGSRQSG